MRAIGVDGPGSTMSEALDAASGGLVFVALAAVLGTIVGVAGWAAATYATAALLLGCAVISAIVGAAVWGLLHWGVDEPTEQPVHEPASDVPFSRAA